MTKRLASGKASGYKNPAESFMLKISEENIILDRSGPTIKMAATAIDIETMRLLAFKKEERKTGEEKEREQIKKGVRIGTLNVGSMTERFCGYCGLDAEEEDECVVYWGKGAKARGTIGV